MVKDEGETNNLAASSAEKIAAAEALLRREVAENRVFPLVIPGVNEREE